MSARTPGPWYADGELVRTHADSHYKAPEVKWVAECGGTFGAGFKAGERTANAAFIVTACNAHDELVAALQGLIDHRDELKLGDYPAVTRARAALAKVQP